MADRFAGAQLAEAARRQEDGEAALRQTLGLGPGFGGVGPGDWVWPVNGVRLKVYVREAPAQVEVADPGRDCDVYALVWTMRGGDPPARLVAWLDAPTLRERWREADGRWMLRSYASNRIGSLATVPGLRIRLRLDAGRQRELLAPEMPDAHVASASMGGEHHVDEPDGHGGSGGGGATQGGD